MASFRKWPQHNHHCTSPNMRATIGCVIQIYGPTIALHSTLIGRYTCFEYDSFRYRLSIHVGSISGGSKMCKRRGREPHFGKKRGVSFTLFQKMHENAIFSPITGGGGVRRVRPMLDPPLGSMKLIDGMSTYLYM